MVGMSAAVALRTSRGVCLSGKLRDFLAMAKHPFLAGYPRGLRRGMGEGSGPRCAERTPVSNPQHNPTGSRRHNRDEDCAQPQQAVPAGVAALAQVKGPKWVERSPVTEKCAP